MENENINWDAALEPAEEREYKPLPIGEYEFVVTAFEKAVSKNGNNMAVVTLDVLTDEGQHYSIIDRLVLTTKMQWKIYQFFVCIGEVKSGETLKKTPWDKVVGGEGRLAVKHDTYNGNTRAVVDKYLPPVGKPKKAKKVVVEEDDGLPFEL